MFFLDNVHGALQLADHIPIRHELDQFKLYHIRGARLIPTLRCSDGTPVIVINQSIHWLHFFLQTNALKKPEFLMDPIISHCLGWFKKPRNSSFNLVMAIWVRNRRSLLIDFLRGISQAGWWLKKNILKKNSQLGCFSHTHRMYAIYGNMDPINIPPMLAYIPAPAGSVMRYILETQKPPTSQEIGQQKCSSSNTT